eukprot:6418973-Prymnesium_polylepis.1
MLRDKHGNPQPAARADLGELGWLEALDIATRDHLPPDRPVDCPRKRPHVAVERVQLDCRQQLIEIAVDGLMRHQTRAKDGQAAHQLQHGSPVAAQFKEQNPQATKEGHDRARRVQLMRAQVGLEGLVAELQGQRVDSYERHGRCLDLLVLYHGRAW